VIANARRDSPSEDHSRQSPSVANQPARVFFEHLLALADPPPGVGGRFQRFIRAHHAVGDQDCVRLSVVGDVHHHPTSSNDW
jgi:hypothetical protein